MQAAALIPRRQPADSVLSGLSLLSRGGTANVTRTHPLFRRQMCFGDRGGAVRQASFSRRLLGPEWVERWARERGKLEALREWRSASGHTVTATH